MIQIAKLDCTCTHKTNLESEVFSVLLIAEIVVVVVVCVCGGGGGEGGGREGGEDRGGVGGVRTFFGVFVASAQSTECTNSSVVPRTAGSVGQRLNYGTTGVSQVLRVSGLCTDQL